MCKGLGSIPILEKKEKEEKPIDYVRKGRRWKMKEKYKGEAGGSQMRRREERAKGKKKEWKQRREAEASSLLGPSICSEINKSIYPFISW